MSRRTFLGTTAAIAPFTIIPSLTMGCVSGHKAPSDKLNIAIVGPGGRGNSMLSNAKLSENIVALCDVDWKHAKSRFEENPDAKKYWDYRRMFDEMGDSIDAVVVSTPDHTHAIIAAQAMTMGKHVYVEKPLTHSVYESRLLTKLAVKHQVATTMGNQISSMDGVRRVCDWIANGEIGEVERVDAFTDRPIWPQGLNTPKQPQSIPETLDWDLFIGPAKMTPYHEVYHPWNHRGWWEFGTGAFGDMACHILHPVFKALKLGYPTKAQGSSSALLTDCAPVSQKVKLTFPARPQFNTRSVRYPEVEVVWTDGGVLPDYPAGWPDGRIWDANLEGPVIFHGTKDKLICGCYGRNPWLLSGRTPTSPKTQREILPAPEGPPLQEGGRPFRPEIHTLDWLRACKENPANRVEPSSHFAEAGPFNEMVVMGVLAVRLQGLNRELLWDGPNMRFTNIGDNDEIRWLTALGEGMSRTQGPVRNAKATAEELIKRTYREGWSLPPMPA